ncbi:MAG: class I SAM-dependent methyltransferase [Elusimicrobia bacterium]|nr:class I SAM-dependent methyltransferase [Elusimicrobiota bacterium]
MLRPFQVRSEIKELAGLVAGLKPSCVLEIGTAAGGTLFLFSRLASPDARIISVDLPRGRFGGGYYSWRIPLYRSFPDPGQRLSLLRADSHSQATFERVGGQLGGRKLDFLFIDGDHTYEGAKRDFEMYSGLVRKGGVVAFHDIVEHPVGEGCGVHRFWREIKAQFPHRELIEDKEQKWAGIGVLFF